MLIRILDFLLAATGIILVLPIMLLIVVAGIFDTGSPVFLQSRLGKEKKTFTLIKFRTMHVSTVSAGTHLVDAASVTIFGGFLRKTKLDELPQLFNVLQGNMSIVGPRPCLVSQNELIEERARRNVFSVKPGITGLAQIHAVDMSTPRKLARYDQLMIKEMSLRVYGWLIIATVFGAGQGDRVSL